MASKGSSRANNTGKKTIKPQTDKPPDLSFLESQSRKARPSKKTTATHVDQDRVQQSPISGQASEPTPTSLLSSTNKTRDNITRLDALYQAQAWFAGAAKKLRDRLALAEEMHEGITHLVDYLARLDHLKAEKTVDDQYLQSPEVMPSNKDSAPSSSNFDQSTNPNNAIPHAQGSNTPDNYPIGIVNVATAQHPGLINRHPYTFANSGHDTHYHSQSSAENHLRTDRELCQTVPNTPPARLRSASTSEMEASRPETSAVAEHHIHPNIEHTLPASDHGNEGHQVRIERAHETKDTAEDQEYTIEQELAALEHAAEAWIARVRVVRAKWNAGARSTERWVGRRA